MMFYGFHGLGDDSDISYANWSSGDCPYTLAVGKDSSGNNATYCCYPGNGVSACGGGPVSSGGSSTSSGGSSTSASVGTGVGAGVGALLNRLLMPGAVTCPVGFIASGTTCIPGVAEPPWYSTPIGIGALLVGAIVAYKVISG